MIWLKIIGKIFRILNAEATPKQIAGGVALGMIIGLTPTFSLHNIVKEKGLEGLLPGLIPK